MSPNYQREITECTVFHATYTEVHLQKNTVDRYTSQLTLSARADVYIRQYTILDDVYVRRFSTISTTLIVQARIVSVT